MTEGLRVSHELKFRPVDFVLINLLVMKCSLSQHIVAELADGRGSEPAECRDRPVVANPTGESAPWHRDAVFRRDPPRGFFLRMTEVV